MNIRSLTVFVAIVGLTWGCYATIALRTPTDLPFIKNTAEECYYLDEFMPVPDGLVNGRTGSISLRYYTYKTANYKDWFNKEVILSFYSQDNRCWSLFEEYYIGT